MNLRRHRKPVTSLFLGMWLFALFAGIANACLTDAASPATGMPEMAMGAGQSDDHGPPPGCRQFCSTDTPVFSKLQLVQDQPAGPPLLIAGIDAACRYVRTAVVAAAYRARPPTDVPPLLRTLRLAL